MTAKEVINHMESLRNDAQRRILMGFFKTGPGEYGEGDEFLGLKVPQTREVVKLVGKDFPLNEIPELLMCRWHEVRLCGLLILVSKFEKLATKRLENDKKAISARDEILTLYLQYAEQANNWDLVDLSVHKILGHWLLLPSNLGDKDYKLKVLDSLAQSPCLWKQRMSMVCSWKTSQMGDPTWCLRYAEVHLHHPHYLMHKAVGWMLREMGKRVSEELLRDFLRQHAHEMPRTMLRYAIEKLPAPERQYWMGIPQTFTPATKSRPNRFAGIAVSQFVEMILNGDDEAMYYLLHDRLNHQLQERYDAYQHHLYDNFEDIIDDFFLYLRENGSYPYESLKRIKNIDSFESWLLNTFRNYLSNRAEAEEKPLNISNVDNALDNTELPELSYEQKLNIISHLIAYAHQVSYPRVRFIFLRSLLTILNKKRAVPNKEMAEALDMSPLSYRVAVYRMKQNVTMFRQRLLEGEKLRLDAEHIDMAEQINNNFDHLYPMLFRLYTECIDALKTSTAVKHLRQQYIEERGYAVHEPASDNHIAAPLFWQLFNHWLNSVVQ